MRLRLLVVILLTFLLDGSHYRLPRAAVNEPIGCVQLPALTGDVTTSTGSCATTSPWHRVSTQTASGGASIAWTGLGATYNDYFINCYGVYPASAASVLVQFGEGGTPTWQTSGYNWSAAQSEGDNTTLTGVSSGGTDAGISVSFGAYSGTSSKTNSFHGVIHNIPGVFYASMEYVLAQSGTSTSFAGAGGGRYPSDTTAKTAVRVIASSGNISGTCNLWGIVAP